MFIYSFFFILKIERIKNNDCSKQMFNCKTLENNVRYSSQYITYLDRFFEEVSTERNEYRKSVCMCVYEAV